MSTYESSTKKMGALGTAGGLANAREQGHIMALQSGVTEAGWVALGAQGRRQWISAAMGALGTAGGSLWSSRAMQKLSGWTDLSATEKAKRGAVKVSEMTAAKKTKCRTGARTRRHRVRGDTGQSSWPVLCSCKTLSRGSPQCCKRPRVDDGAPP